MESEKLIAVITENARSVFRQPGLTYAPGLMFRDILGFDSVQAVQFILAMEESLGVTISEEEVDRMHSMGDAFHILLAKQPIGAG